MRQPKARGVPGGRWDRMGERRKAPRGDGWRGQPGAAWSGRCRAFLRPARRIVPAPGLRRPVAHPSRTTSADGASLVVRGRPPPLWRREMIIRRRRWGGGLRPRAAIRPPQATGRFRSGRHPRAVDLPRSIDPAQDQRLAPLERARAATSFPEAITASRPQRFQRDRCLRRRCRPAAKAAPSPRHGGRAL